MAAGGGAKSGSGDLDAGGIIPVKYQAYFLPFPASYLPLYLSYSMSLLQNLVFGYVALVLVASTTEDS